MGIITRLRSKKRKAKTREEKNPQAHTIRQKPWDKVYVLRQNTDGCFDLYVVKYAIVEQGEYYVPLNPRKKKSLMLYKKEYMKDTLCRTNIKNHVSWVRDEITTAILIQYTKRIAPMDNITMRV